MSTELVRGLKAHGSSVAKTKSERRFFLATLVELARSYGVGKSTISRLG